MWPLASADVDGDGVGDLVVVEWLDFSTYELRAFDGSDGSTLWRTARNTSEVVYYLTDDRFGEFRLILFESDVRRDPRHPYNCSCAYTQKISAYRGVDGAQTWSATSQGVILTTSDLLPSDQQASEPAIVLAKNFITGLEPIYALPGSDEFLINRVDVVGGSAIAGYRTTTTVALIDADDGEERTGFEHTSERMIPQVIPMGDASGDGIWDVAILDGSTLSARSLSGDVLWSREVIADARIVLLAPLAAYGFGSTDVAILNLYALEQPPGVIGPLIGPQRLTIITGMGTERWSLSTEVLGEFQPSGDQDGDGIQDYFLFTYPESKRTTVDVIGGTDGGSLWDRTWEETPPPGWDIHLHPIIAGNLDGVGGSDLVFMTNIYRETEAGFEDLVIDLEAMRGASGSFLWRSSPSRWGEIPDFTGFDMNANGTEDLFTIEAEPGGIEAEWVASLVLREGSTLALIGAPYTHPSTRADPGVWLVDAMFGSSAWGAFAMWNETRDFRVSEIAAVTDAAVLWRVDPSS